LTNLDAGAGGRVHKLSPHAREKEHIMRLRYSIIVALAVSLAVAPAHANTGFSANLSGLQEVPPNASPGSGTGFFVLDNSGTTISWSVTFSGLVSPLTATHLHASTTSCPGTNAGVQLPLNGPVGATSGSYSGSGPVNATLGAALTSFCSGGCTEVYINIHTSVFPGGEIRGQLCPDITPARPSSWGRIKMLYR
jgi:hypothetical protein